MSLLETINLSHLPPSTPVHIALYRDVKNAPFLRQQLLSGNTEFEYAFIDASMVRLIIHLVSLDFEVLTRYRFFRGRTFLQLLSGPSMIT